MPSLATTPPAPHVASGQAAYALGVSSDLKVFLGRPCWRPAPRDRQRAPADPAPAAGRPPDRRSPRWARRRRRGRGASCRGATARSSGAPASVRARHARHDWREARRLRPKSGCSASGNSRAATVSATTWWTAIHGALARARPARAPAVGHRTAVSGAQRRTRTRSLRGPQPAGLATPRRLTAIAYSFLQTNAVAEVRRISRCPRSCCHPRGLDRPFFMTQPGYFKWMLKLKDVRLRMKSI